MLVPQRWFLDPVLLGVDLIHSIFKCAFVFFFIFSNFKPHLPILNREGIYTVKYRGSRAVRLRGCGIVYGGGWGF